MRYLGIFLGALLLSGCAEGYGELEPPVVDSYGHSPEQLAADQHECIEKRREHGFVGAARMITNCMEQKGYPILTPKG